jgi:hypothetical protein
MYKFLAMKLTGHYGMKTFPVCGMDPKAHTEVLPKEQRTRLFVASFEVPKIIQPHITQLPVSNFK